MTEAEWMRCKDPQKMLEALQGKASDRKLRLFACACCRRIWHLLTDIRWQEAVETVERYTDGVATLAEFNQAGEIARAASRDAEMSYVSGGTEGLLAARAEEMEEVSVESMIAAIVVPVGVQAASAAMAAAWGGEHLLTQNALIRDIFGNPLRTVELEMNPHFWLEANITKIAQAIYDGRRFEDLPVLADALEEAGCQDADILGHCRGPGPHVRGCWVLDLVLGKAL
jgi:hypothetical protein